MGFSLHHHLAPMRHDYLVDSDPAKWGTRFHGFEVRSPTAIAQEDPSHTIIVIYPFRSARQVILTTLDAMGPYMALPPVEPFALRTFALRLERGLDSGLVRKQPALNDHAILVQGPLTEGITESVMRYYAKRHSEEWLILSTWADSPAELIAQVEPFCDRLLLNVPPDHAGPGNRNMQLVSTRAGLEECARLGLSKVIKTRTDALVSGDHIFSNSIALQAGTDASRCRALGMSGRILVTERYTLRYIPYHVSDILMFGDTEDLLRFWSVPLDPRRYDPMSSEWHGKTYRELSRERALAEIYFTRHFLDSLGWEASHTLEDHWTMLRDLFVVLDERWFGHCFPRYDSIPLDDGRNPDEADILVDYAYWRHLQEADMTAEAAGIDLDRIRYRHMWERRNLRGMDPRGNWP